MKRLRSAVVKRSSALNGGGWCAIIMERGEKQFVTVSENHPEGTRLVFKDGAWVKP